MAEEMNVAVVVLLILCQLKLETVVALLMFSTKSSRVELLPRLIILRLRLFVEGTLFPPWTTDYVHVSTAVNQSVCLSQDPSVLLFNSDS